MAGGKLTPRQKMINLMYLVFIAMLALNMSKEVLSAFGMMDEKFKGVNAFSNEYNQGLYDQLASKASENSAQFGVPFQKAKQIKPIVDEFYKFIESVKVDVVNKFEPIADGPHKGKLDYEKMDRSTIDELWFSGDGYSKRGNEIISAIEKFKSGIKSIIGNDVKYQIIVKDILEKFSTEDVVNRSGVEEKYLSYHYKGFPAVASVSKLSAMQNDVKKAEQDLYNALIGNTTAAAASMKNYRAFVMMDKSAFFQGEQVTGRVVLGRYDESTVPQSVSVNGASTSIDNGSAVFKMGAGSVGEKDINGKFTFLEDGKSIEIPIEGNYVVVPKPNQATISADKMNVVYRGIPNPMTISFAGVSSDKVNAQAPGMSKGAKPGQYNLVPGQGREVLISVTATLPDGTKVSDKKTFRIKGIPNPTGKIRGEVAAVGSKVNAEVCSISAVLEDFDFPVSFNVTQFNLKVPGQATIVVRGSKMDDRAKAAIRKASKGDVIVISEIKGTFSGINQMPKSVSACTFEIQ